MPRTPTLREDQTFAKHVAEMPLGCHWYAEDRLDALAAKHPGVGEYYFSGGADRLRTLAAEYANVFDRQNQGVPVSATDVADTASNLLDALNHGDPHFTRSFTVSPIHNAPALPRNAQALQIEHLVVGDKIFQLATFERYAVP